MYTFNLLRGEVVEQVAGSFDQKFWTFDVLRAAEMCPAIWHAGLAMTAMHNRSLLEEKLASAVRRQYYAFALEQYNASIKYLIDITRATTTGRLNYEQQETLLLVNLLFLGICCLQKDIQTAVSHARNILRFYYQWEFWENENKTCSLLRSSSLIALITNVESQFANRLDYISRPECREHQRPPTFSVIPYKSVTDCYFELQSLVNRLLHAYRKFGSPNNAVRANPTIHIAYRKQFQIWMAKFNRYTSKNVLQSQDAGSVLTMKIMATGLDICLSMDPGASLLQWDKFTALFEKMVEMAEDLYKMLNKGQQSHLSRFSFSPSLSEVFCFVGTSCRNHNIRRRLIALAEKWPLWDGIWDPKLVALVCRAMMDMEEEPGLVALRAGIELTTCGCCFGSFICEGHRVAVVNTRFVGPGDTRVSMRTLEDEREGRMEKEICIPW